MGWFYGFKLHIIVNHLGEIDAAKVTPANVDDRKSVPALANDLEGKLYADKGYISQTLGGELFEKGVELITNVRKNMKARLSVPGTQPCFQGVLLLKPSMIN